MQRRRANGSQITFQYKLFLTYSLVVLLPVVVLGTLAYRFSLDAVRERTDQYIAGTVNQMVDNIGYRLDAFGRMSDQIFFDESIQEALRLSEAGWEMQEEATKTIFPKLESALKIAQENVALSLYLRNETFPELYYDHTKIKALTMGKVYEVYHFSRLNESDWYAEASRSLEKFDPIWRQVGDDRAEGSISLLRQTADLNNQKPIGLLRIRAEMKDVFQSLFLEKFGVPGYLFVQDASGKILYGSDPNRQLLMSWTKPDDGYYTIDHAIPDTAWTLVVKIPYAELRKESVNVRNVTILSCFACLLLLLLINFVVSGYFSKRIRKIVSFLGVLKDGELSRRFRYSGQDEFGYIAFALNEMAENIDDLIRKVYVAGLEKKEAELRVLQSQINPHLLYNALSSITKMAKMNMNEEIHDMALGLAKFYRLTLNEGKTLIGIDQEIEQIKAYIGIQHIRYGDRFSVHYDLDPAAMGYQTIKLILQPFVENVFEHAWYRGRVHIRIVVRKEGERIVFKVIDDGAGIRPETTAQILGDGEVKPGYGIRNVDERIKLQFGEAYGVAIASRPGIGTGVQIDIPVSRQAPPASSPISAS
ncbi:cache domain-containing sensor histidine kinase [Cohnella nanjingensis]|uniref:Sensor histidine kinase n=1 Tax=Cohnella nanjingensis TaxID=1387779 RepID=A0A7X0VFU0_9BACL|nr:sensor histidine kinase [Cohnella nanjingensis]MBB6671633.1 sensor histidine kinase [Cohnella nanjingensis]